MTRRHDQYLQRLSKLMPATYPINVKNVQVMLKKAYILRCQYKARTTSNFQNDVPRRLFLYYAQRYADMYFGHEQCINYMKFRNGFMNVAYKIRKIFEEAEFPIDIELCHIDEILATEWNRRKEKTA